VGVLITFSDSSSSFLYAQKNSAYIVRHLVFCLFVHLLAILCQVRIFWTDGRKLKLLGRNVNQNEPMQRAKMSQCRERSLTFIRSRSRSLFVWISIVSIHSVSCDQIEKKKLKLFDKKILLTSIIRWYAEHRFGFLGNKLVLPCQGSHGLYRLL
jgi:hypothetical protein